MKKTRSFLLTAGIALALVFTLSCSDDKDGDPTSSSSGIGGIPPELSNQQVSFDGLENGIKIDLFMLLSHEDGEYEYEYDDGRYDLLPAGKIENGLLSLNLPTADKIGKYLNELKAPYYYVRVSYLVADIPGESDCRLRVHLINSGKGNKTGIRFWYLSDAVRPSPDEHEDLNFSKGWNLVYSYYDEANEDSRMNTTDPSKVDGGTLEWRLECNDK